MDFYIYDNISVVVIRVVLISILEISDPLPEIFNEIPKNFYCFLFLCTWNVNEVK